MVWLHYIVYSSSEPPSSTRVSRFFCSLRTCTLNLGNNLYKAVNQSTSKCIFILGINRKASAAPQQNVNKDKIKAIEAPSQCKIKKIYADSSIRISEYSRKKTISSKEIRGLRSDPADIYFYPPGMIPYTNLPSWSPVIPQVKSIVCPALKLYFPRG